MSRSMTVKDVATELGVSPATVLKYIEKGDLPAADIGTGAKSYWRIERTAFEDFYEAARAKAARRFGGVG